MGSPWSSGGYLATQSLRTLGPKNHDLRNKGEEGGEGYAMLLWKV